MTQNLINNQSKPLTPRQIVAELDKYVIAQHDAKRAIAIALRNRWRRKQADPEIRDEIYPHNILMLGPTGVGKTEIARRVAKLSNAPFLKVEATKFTEVGYVGRDVDSIIRDLAEIAFNIVKEEHRKIVEEGAKQSTHERLLVALIGETPSAETKEKFTQKLLSGELDEKEIEIDVNESLEHPFLELPGLPSGAHMGVINIGEALSKAFGGGKTKRVKLQLKHAYKLILKEESDKLMDDNKTIKEAVQFMENEGIVFLDEIDKICRSSEGGSSSRGEVSREGVQRDLLSIIDGCIVSTKYGPVKTDRILFIASGAFHLAKPSDLLPELQGRLPIRVELKPLEEQDFVSILKETKHSLLKQYQALFAAEKVKIEFTEDGISAIARISAELNREVENIGARRLHTILEKVLEELSFNASELGKKKIIIDEKYVTQAIGDIMKRADLTKFIL